MTDRPPDRSWTVPVSGVIVVVLGVVVFVAVGGQFAPSSPTSPSSSPVACACEPPPPSHTPGAGAEAYVSEEVEGVLTVGFDENHDDVALLVVFAPNESAPPANPDVPTNGSPNATPDAANVTFLNGSVAVEDTYREVGVTDRGLRLPEEGAGVDLAVDGAVHVRVIAVPPPSSDRNERVVATWNASA